MDNNSILITGERPFPRLLILTVRMNDCGAPGFIGELTDPDTRLVVAGGLLPVVESWLISQDYTLVPKSKGYWAQKVHKVVNV
jgi:hypothetical protein